MSLILFRHISGSVFLSNISFLVFCLRIKSSKFDDNTWVLHSNYYNSLLDSAESYFTRRTASFLWENVVDFYNLIRGLHVRRRFAAIEELV